MRINICRRSRATIVAPSRGVWRGVLRPPAGWFETRHTPPADSHVRTGTVRRGGAGRDL
jgi:hypothetical protein